MFSRFSGLPSALGQGSTVVDGNKVACQQAPTSHAIVFDNVSFGYNSNEGNVVEVLSNLSINSPAAKFFGIVGPSGSGKTTILRLISDLITPEQVAYMAGSITILSGLPSAARQKRTFGFLFQDSVLFPWRNVLQNVTLPLQIMGSSNASDLGRAHELLDVVGLSQFKHNRVSELSGGMQQRVSLVRALITNPSILLLDEPFASQDFLVREQLMKLLQELWQDAMPTVIFVSHDLADAVTLCDSIAVLSKRPGRLLKLVHVDLVRPRTYRHQLDPEYPRALKAVRDALTDTTGGVL